MRHHTTAYIVNGDYSARCICGWRYPEPLPDIDPANPERVAPARPTVEEVIHAAQAHALEEARTENWECELAEELRHRAADWLNDRQITTATVDIDHDHYEDGTGAAAFTLRVHAVELAPPVWFGKLDTPYVEHGPGELEGRAPQVGVGSVIARPITAEYPELEP